MRDGDARGLQIRGKVDMAKLFHIVIPWGRQAKAMPHACEMRKKRTFGFRSKEQMVKTKRKPSVICNYLHAQYTRTHFFLRRQSIKTITGKGSLLFGSPQGRKWHYRSWHGEQDCHFSSTSFANKCGCHLIHPPTRK